VFTALTTAFAARVRGRTVAAVFTLGGAGEAAFGARLAGNPVWRREEAPTAVVDLTAGLAHVEAHVLSNNRRNERNRGLKRGCTLHASSAPDDLAAWYPLYRDAARGWDQAPVPLAFMQDLARSRPDRAFLVQVRRAGEIIGGHFCVHWGDRVRALYGASRRDIAKECFPATLLYWQDLVEGCARGAAWLDFGGFAGQAGLHRFKRLMGASEERRAQYTCAQPAWRVMTAARQRWRGGRS
jgi:predicted N-acyltransferase